MLNGACDPPTEAEEYPRVELSNSAIQATIYLPDMDNGYYRGTRFEWGGVFGRLEYAGSNYAARWYEPHDPRRHDSLGGPIQEFVTDQSNNAGLGYESAAPGESFVKIGVGVLRRPDATAYRFAREYEIVDSGQWIVHSGQKDVKFVHDLADPRTGYAYRYTKVIRLEDDLPVISLEHRLENTGERAIETSVYNHNFLVMEDAPAGPATTVALPFDLEVIRRGPLAALHVAGGTITFQRKLSEGESLRYEFDGFGGYAESNDIRVESAATGRGVRISGDRPLSHFALWAVPSVISPEVYLRMRVDSGGAHEWTTRYTFYQTSRVPAR